MKNSKKPKVRILVMGGRFAPHLLGIVAEPPDIVEMIISKDTQAKLLEPARDTLKHIAGLQISDKPLAISAYNLREAREACRKIVNQYPVAEITFDATSAPKIPGYAAMDIARELDHRLIYVDSSNGRIITLAPVTDESDVDIRIDLESYLRCFGRRSELTFDPQQLSVSPATAGEAATYLAQGNETAVQALEILRKSGQGKGKRTIPFKKTKPVSAPVFSVLQGVANFGLIRNLQQAEDGRVSYTIENEHDYKFLEGNWLEFYVYLQAQDCREENKEPLFNDVKMSVEIPSNGARKEIDVACMVHGQLLLVSCKAGSKPFRTEYLDELRAVSDLVGGDFTTRIFVTNALPPEENKNQLFDTYDKFLQQAKDRKTVVVTGDKLCQISTILKKEALDPEFRRI